MDDYIAKPVSVRTLVEVLEKWLPKKTEPATDQTSRASEGTASLGVQDAGTSVFNKEAMLERLMGDKGLGRKVLDGFLMDIPRQIQTLREFLKVGYLSGVGCQAHTIMGAAANVGGEALHAVAFEMEKVCKVGDLGAAKACLSELETQFDRLKAAINQNREL